MRRTKLETRVAKGAKFLDKHVPGWVQKFIKNGRKYGFDMGDPTICILGNVFHDAAGRSGFWGAVGKFPELHSDDGVSYGFNATAEEENAIGCWATLAHFWQVEILTRLCQRNRKLIGKALSVFGEREV